MGWMKHGAHRCEIHRVITRMVAGLVTLSLSSCAVSELAPQRDPAPLVPFTNFSVVESGGVDGRRNELLVRADGVGLLLSREPSAGRVGEPTMNRLRTLLESEQFRTEVAARTGETEPPNCTDQIAVGVTMGSLSMSRSGPCTGEAEPDTPAFDEILRLTAPAFAGSFDLPVPAGAPELVGVRLVDRGDDGEPGYRIDVDPAGKGALTVPGEAARPRTLSRHDRDTLRLLLPRLAEGPDVQCDDPGRYSLAVALPEPVAGSQCTFSERRQEFRSVVALLERAFDA